MLHRNNPAIPLDENYDPPPLLLWIGSVMTTVGLSWTLIAIAFG